MFEYKKINEELENLFECFESRQSAVMFQHRGNV